MGFLGHTKQRLLRVSSSVMMMGIYKEEEERYVVAKKDGGGAVNVKKTYIIITWSLSSFLVSMTGGIILGLWEYRYHPRYRQLWMVPLGLILFLTPIIVLLAVFVSELCCMLDDDDEVHGWGASESSVCSSSDSVHDPESRLSKK